MRLPRSFAALALFAAVPALAQNKPDDKPDEEATYYRLDEIEIPKEAYLEVGALAFTPDGTLYVSTRRGEIWARKADRGGKAKWWVFASGLRRDGAASRWPGRVFASAFIFAAAGGAVAVATGTGRQRWCIHSSGSSPSATPGSDSTWSAIL